jgi:ABC-2 type transport system permease protein
MTATTAGPAAAPLRRGFDLSALGALFGLSLRQYLRGRRVLILSLLFLLPSALAAVARFAPHAPPPGHLEFVFVFNLIPHALATLTALLYAAGVIQDEVEDQTLTYLLARPIPRWALYVTKLLVAFLITSVLTGVFTVLTLAVLHWNTPDLWGDVLPGRALRIVGLLTLAQAGYCALFGVLGLVTRWSLVIGLGYIVVFEGLLATVPTVARRLTMMYYFRVLAVRWLDPADNKIWELDLNTAPTARGCVLTLLGAAAGLTLIGAALMTRREFRVKTPEGS